MEEAQKDLKKDVCLHKMVLKAANTLFQKKEAFIKRVVENTDNELKENQYVHAQISGKEGSNRGELRSFGPHNQRIICECKEIYVVLVNYFTLKVHVCSIPFQILYTRINLK